MTGKSHFFTSLLIFIAGILLIVMYRRINIMETIVAVIGCVMLIPGLINLIVAAFSRRGAKAENRAGYAWSLAASVFAIALGIALLIAPHFFAQIIAYVFAALLIAAGAYHILAVSYLARPFVLPFYFYIIPLLLIAAGFVILFTGVRAIDAVVVLITGIAMVASSLSSLLEYVATHPGKSREKELPATEEK